MLQTARKPRFVRLFVVMAVLVAAFVWLGNWQWGTAHSSENDKVLETQLAKPRVPLTQVMKPQTMFDNDMSLQPISVSGTYDVAHTKLVAGRALDKVDGYWLMTPLVVDGTGARLPIVRGFVTQTTHLPKPPSGRVTIEGALAPGESASQLGDLPAGQIGTIDIGLLLNEWGGTIYNAFIFTTKQTPATVVAAGDAQVQAVPPPVPGRSHIEWRNAAYALQWWVFAAFTVFMWFKLVRDEAREDAALAAAADVTAADGHASGDAASDEASRGTTSDDTPSNSRTSSGRLPADSAVATVPAPPREEERT